MREKQRKFLKEFEREKSQRLAALDDTEEAEKAYKAWLREQTMGKQWMNDMVDELSRKATEANESAVATLLDQVPGVYAGNANYEAYAIEKSLKARTAFTLVSEDVVRNLVTGRGSRAAVAGRLLPEVTFPKVDRPKDYRWNRQKFTSAITQGILQGESIPNIVKRTESIFGSNQAAAYRAARTAVGSAQNSGRYFSMLRAEDMGIIIKKKWKATHDERTRDSHVELDGAEVPVEEPFESEHGPILYPKDPAAHPSEVWNCRCTIEQKATGFKPLAESYEHWREVQGMSYQEWEAAVAGGRTAAHKIVEGKDILGTWKRRPDKYDFEIEDVMAAQGFDGKPRIVGADEFDRAVKEANNGEGLIMQRTYSAPDQETLDAYRQQLYDGKWYVDCSTGGAQYGQGMYCAADYSGVLSDGIKGEMERYMALNRQRGSSHAYIETMTLDPSANIVRYDRKLKRAAKKWGAERADAEYSAMMGRLMESVPEEERLLVKRYLGAYGNINVDMTWDEISLADDLEKTHKDLAKKAKKTYQDIKADAQRLDAQRVQLQGGADVGAYAAAMGYDAINAVGHGQSGSYTVVLNRTKLIIRRPE